MRKRMKYNEAYKNVCYAVRNRKVCLVCVGAQYLL